MISHTREHRTHTVKCTGMKPQVVDNRPAPCIQSSNRRTFTIHVCVQYKDNKEEEGKGKEKTQSGTRLEQRLPLS